MNPIHDQSLSDQREIAMSDASSVGPANTTAQPFWNTRNIIGLIVLAGVTAIGAIEYSAYFGHKWAVSALNTRASDEDKELMTISEAEKLLGKEPDGPASEFNEGVWNFDQKTYTWSGLLKKHTVTAYYTKGKDARLHHFESDGAKLEPAPVRTVEISTQKQQPPPGARGGGGGGAGKTKSKTSSAAKDKTDSKDKAADADDKGADAKDKAAKADSAPKADPAADPAAKAKDSAADSAAKPKTPEPGPSGDTPK
jgi:hypothetical protein